MSLKLFYLATQCTVCAERKHTGSRETCVPAVGVDDVPLIIDVNFACNAGNHPFCVFGEKLKAETTPSTKRKKEDMMICHSNVLTIIPQKSIINSILSMLFY